MNKNPNWRVAETICIFVLLVINTLVATEFLIKMQESLQDSGQRDALPCGALPAQFVIEEPDCADKLLRFMNITNVHIMPAEDFDPLVNETIFGLQNESAENKYRIFHREERNNPMSPFAPRKTLMVGF